MKFNIGDVVYQSQAGSEQVWTLCPECLGSGRLRVILGDDSEVSIPCVCCERGYEGSPGKRQTYEFIGRAAAQVIIGVEARQSGDELQVRYYFSGGYSAEAKNVFATREEALVHAFDLVAEHEAEEKKRLGYKEKQHKTWASNIAYWRAEIRRCKEDIARYEARLAAAPKNIKQADKLKPEETL